MAAFSIDTATCFYTREEAGIHPLILGEGGSEGRNEDCFLLCTRGKLVRVSTLV